MRAFIATPRRAIAARWRRLLETLGTKVADCADIEALRRSAASGDGGLALVDWELAGLGPRRRIKSLTTRLGNLRVVLFGGARMLYGPDCARALSAGAAGLLCEEDSDEALLRGLRAQLDSIPDAEALLLSPGGTLRVDTLRRLVELRAPSGKWRAAAGLTPLEFDLLCVLLRHPSTALPRQGLMARLWGERSQSVNPEVVDHHVASLRRKLGRAGALIRTVRGIGYELA